MLIKKIRKLLLNYHFNAFMAISILFASCTKDTLIDDFAKDSISAESIDNISERASNYSPEQIFKGIIFANGPVVDLIPELTAFKASNLISNKEQLKEIHTYQNLLVAQFEAKYPGYLEQFQVSMTSGNHLQIKKEIKMASTKLKVVIEDFSKAASKGYEKEIAVAQNDLKTALKDANIDQNDPKAIANFAKEYFETINSNLIPVVVLVVLVAIAVAAAVVIVFVVFDILRTNNGSTLLQDKLVNSIATNLI